MADAPARQLPPSPLRGSFQHLPGIGVAREERLWSEGVLDWGDLVERVPVQMDMFHKRGSELYAAVEESERAFEHQDVAFFQSRLPKREHYRIAATFPDLCTFLDIESTGLSTYYDHVTLVGWSTGRTYSVLIDPAHTTQLESVLHDHPIVVTYNGTLFDLPFLGKRLNTDWSGSIHVDLRYLAKRVGLTGGQKKIELALGFARGSSLDGVTGAEAVTLWFDYKEGDLDALRKLVRYNHADIEGMKRVFEVVLGRLGLRGACGATGDLFPRSVVRFSERPQLEDPNTVSVIPYRGHRGPKLVLADLCATTPSLDQATVVGIDLTGSEKRKSGWAAVTGGHVVLDTLSSDAELIDRTLAANPLLVSIDSPLSLPSGRLTEFDDDPGRDKYGIVRAAERELRKRGINVYPALLPSMQRLTRRGVEMATYLRERGVPVIESYPGAAQDILGIPRKKTSLRHLCLGLRRFGYAGLSQQSDISHDELDAATSALVGQFMLAGYWEGLGSPDEDYLIVPTVDRRDVDLTPEVVVGISGPIAAGKTTAAKILEGWGFRYSRFSEIIAQDAVARGMPIDRSTLQALGEEAHASRFGQRRLQNALAMLVGSARRIVVDGLRHPEDRAFLDERWGYAAIHVHISAHEEVRALRYAAKPGETMEAFYAAEAHRVEQNVSRLEDLADVILTNAGTIPELTSQLGTLIEERQTCQ